MSLLAFVLPLLAQTVTADYTANAEAGFHGLQGWYNTTSGLWDTCGWWNGANCKTAIGDLAVVDSSIVSEATKVFANTYSVAPAYNPQPLKTGDVNSADPIAWCDHCYDDNGWWALAWVQAYDVTKNRDYLDLAKANFDQNMVNAGPTDYSDGGVVWCDINPYVNAIANELYLSVSAHLTIVWIRRTRRTVPP
jgi:hypothetical protein